MIGGLLRFLVVRGSWGRQGCIRVLDVLKRFLRALNTVLSWCGRVFSMLRRLFLIDCMTRAHGLCRRLFGWLMRLSGVSRRSLGCFKKACSVVKRILDCLTSIFGWWSSTSGCLARVMCWSVVTGIKERLNQKRWRRTSRRSSVVSSLRGLQKRPWSGV